MLSKQVRPQEGREDSLREVVVAVLVVVVEVESVLVLVDRTSNRLAFHTQARVTPKVLLLTSGAGGIGLNLTATRDGMKQAIRADNLRIYRAYAATRLAANVNIQAAVATPAANANTSVSTVAQLAADANA